MSEFRLSPTLRLTAFELRTRDAAAMATWYRDLLGFEVTGTAADRTTMVLPGRAFEMTLLDDPGAVPRPYPCPGLYHFALLVPDRAALGTILRRLLDRSTDMEGMSDHLVSEALYLRDPDFNGIELYRDRPSGEWPRERDGSVRMAADPLDTDAILAAAEGPGPLHPDTVLGHVHMHVPSLERAEAFYGAALGLRVTQRSYRGALFLAAGDYHHHVGTNTWTPDREVPGRATGMVSCTWTVDAAGLATLREHLARTGDAHRALADGGVGLTDPGGVEIRVVAS